MIAPCAFSTNFALSGGLIASGDFEPNHKEKLLRGLGGQRSLDHQQRIATAPLSVTRRSAWQAFRRFASRMLRLQAGTVLLPDPSEFELFVISGHVKLLPVLMRVSRSAPLLQSKEQPALTRLDDLIRYLNLCQTLLMPVACWLYQRPRQRFGELDLGFTVWADDGWFCHGLVSLMPCGFEQL